jgi:hypothetical protein
MNMNKKEAFKTDSRQNLTGLPRCVHGDLLGLRRNVATLTSTN